ncbi:MAG: PEGA domain-containing protein [Polyangiaceae bacterium]
MRPYSCLLVVGLTLMGRSTAAQSGTEVEAADVSDASADTPSPPEDPSRTKARSLFMEGVARVKQAQWSEALASFEASQLLFPHATTTFNIGACERAMGRYTRARQALRRALAQADRGEGQLAPSLRVEANGYIAEIERLLVRLDVRLDTPGSRIAIDGRPLVDEGAEYSAGIAPPGLGAKAPGARFKVVMDPGAHVITLSRKGYADAVVNRSYPLGTKASLNLQLERLPATLQISSNVKDAIVSVDGKDFGPAPVSVLRPPGRYSVLVNRDGFEPYEATVNVKPGEESALRATLVEERFQLTKQWWFWAGAAAVVVGGAALTYYLTRPDPEPKPYDSGSTGWLVEPIRF